MDRWQPCTADTAPIVECTVTYEVHCNNKNNPLKKGLGGCMVLFTD